MSASVEEMKCTQEIGGYLGLEEMTGKEFYPELLALNTGRNALLYILQARNIGRLYIPFFLCNSIAGLCKKYGYTFEYYHIDGNFRPVFEKKLEEYEFIYIVNYFGQITSDEAQGMKQKYTNIIFDNVQAFFQKPVEGIDTIYSCRKFFGVPDGSYLSTNCFLSEELEQDVSSERMAHLLGRYEGCASKYYGAFKQNDRCFDDLPLMSMSRLTCNLLKGLDYQAIKERRERNWGILDHKLGALNEMPLACPIGPYMYPLYCRNGMRIKEELAGKGIYVPTLWPNVLGECPEGSIEYQYAADILPLPVDQRYGEEEMERMVYEIQHIGNSRG